MPKANVNGEKGKKKDGSPLDAQLDSDSPPPALHRVRRAHIQRWLEQQEDSEEPTPESSLPHQHMQVGSVAILQRTTDGVTDVNEIGERLSMVELASAQRPSHSRDWSISTRESAILEEANPEGLDRRCPESGMETQLHLPNSIRDVTIPEGPPALLFQPWIPALTPTRLQGDVMNQSKNVQPPLGTSPWPQLGTSGRAEATPNTTSVPQIDLRAPTASDSPLPAHRDPTQLSKPNPGPALVVVPPTPASTLTDPWGSDTHQPSPSGLLTVPGANAPVAPLPQPHTESLITGQEQPSHSDQGTAYSSSWHGKMVRIENIDHQWVSVNGIKRRLWQDYHFMAFCYEVMMMMEADAFEVYIGFHARASAEVARRQINGLTFGGRWGVVASVI